MEGLEAVPNSNDAWGEMGLATVVCSESAWNRREDDALTIKLSQQLERWEEEKQQQDNDGNLPIWISKPENKKPTLGTRKPHPKPPANPGQFKANPSVGADANTLKLHNHVQETTNYLTFQSANACAVGLIKDPSVLGEDIFSSSTVSCSLKSAVLPVTLSCQLLCLSHSPAS